MLTRCSTLPLSRATHGTSKLKGNRGLTINRSTTVALLTFIYFLSISFGDESLKVKDIRLSTSFSSIVFPNASATEIENIFPRVTL